MLTLWVWQQVALWVPLGQAENGFGYLAIWHPVLRSITSWKRRVQKVKGVRTSQARHELFDPWLLCKSQMVRHRPELRPLKKLPPDASCRRPWPYAPPCLWRFTPAKEKT